MRRFALALALCAPPALAESPAATGTRAVPETAVEPVTETIHGNQVVDPYRWLEGSAAPEVEESAELDARVSAWIDAQNTYTRSVLDTIPGRAPLEARLRELMEVGVVGSPTMRRNRYFYKKREGSQAQYVAYLRIGADGEDRVLLDVNQLHADGLLALSWTAPNHDGTLMAFGTYLAGDENSTLHILDVDSGDWLADEIPGKVGSVYWLPDSSGFVYSRLADVENAYSRQIKLHRVGRHHSQDPILFEQYKEGPMATTWGPFASLSKDARWLQLGYWTGTDSNDLWVVDFDRYLRTGEFITTEVVTGAKATASGEFHGDTLYLQTTVDAPNGRLVAVDLHNPGRAAWKEILPTRTNAVLKETKLARDRIVALYLEVATSRVEMFGYRGEELGELELPGIGSAGLAVADDRTEAFLTYTSFNEPRSIYRVDLATGARSLWARPEVPVDPDIVDVKQVFFKSKDGTQVPMFVVHKKGLKLDGDNPTLLNGYGGFNIPMTPRFSATLFPWLEAGGVYALANLRGGSEYGEAWHRAGMLEHKQNVFDDFYAAAEWLIDNHYTSSANLGIQGGSNGGLLTGAALVQRPELFSAVIPAVPLLDMLRYQHFLMARFWVPEYGTAEDPEHFPFLRAYSPYHNVVKGVRYPATLFTAGENDSRVHYLHAAKMAAMVQARTASDPHQEPVLLWVDRSSGHGQGKPLHLRVRDVADRYIFMMRELGMLAGNGKRAGVLPPSSVEVADDP